MLRETLEISKFIRTLERRAQTKKALTLLIVPFNETGERGGLHARRLFSMRRNNAQARRLVV